jgi:hypothetical protein
MTSRLLLRTTLIGCLVFTLLGAALSSVAFLRGVAESGYQSPSLSLVVLNDLALWPDYALYLLVPHQALESLFQRYPLLYLFGFPIIGWSLLGVAFMFWRTKRS